MYDSRTGLVYLRARYYTPGNGRFMSRDAWAGNNLNPITLNEYLYANANPTIVVDPTGFISQKEDQKAQDILNRLKVYNVGVKKDWGFSYTYYDPTLGISPYTSVNIR
jgi:RHS repeat-associated protein